MTTNETARAPGKNAGLMTTDEILLHLPEGATPDTADGGGVSFLTVSLDGPTETAKTAETADGMAVSNDAFLSVMFAGATGDHSPVVASFSGNPSTMSRGVWIGRRWQEGKSTLPEDENAYFSLASFRPNDAGEYRRKKTQFAALHVVMLDDLGGKVPMDRLTLPPTYLLETSKGNYQAGYLLEEPITDGLLSDRLMKAIIAADLCDPGADGPQARLARLPVGINGKHSPPFACRMAEWHPNITYSVEAIVEGLQLDFDPSPWKRPDAPVPRTRTRVRAAPTSHAEGDPVLIERPDTNPVIAVLRERGLYKSPLGDGKHDITCPWVHEHTDGVDGGTAYFEPDDNYPIGGFRCLHGHCAGRTVRTLLEELDIAIGPARMKPTVYVIAGEIHRVVDSVEKEIAQSGRIYQRGGLVTCIVTDPGTRETRTQELSQPALLREMARAAIWQRLDARADAWVRIDPPARHAAVLFDSHTYPHLPVLKGLTRHPYLREDGSLMATSGYDTAAEMFGVFDARTFSIAKQPSRADAEAAMSLLGGLLAEFDFAGDTDRAAALAAMLTAVARPSLSAAPMFHVRAHMVGSGKSYLCELITAFATPQRGTPTSFPTDDEECQKMLLANLLRSPAVIEFDNLTGDLVAHKSLCMALTSEYMSGRILGVSKMANVTTRALFLSSGNNVGPVQDMVRRCLTIRLAPQCEVPAARSFTRPDLVREVLRDRGRYVSAALTIIRAWIVAGRPKTECRALASYCDWSDLCRQPLLWLGCLDPTVSVFEAMADDPDRETLARLLHAWNGAFANVPTTINDAIALAAGDIASDLREVFHDIADEHGGINRKRLGWWMRRHAGRIVDRLRIVTNRGGRVVGWRVESVASPTAVSAVSAVSLLPIEKCVTTNAHNYRAASRG